MHPPTVYTSIIVRRISAIAAILLLLATATPVLACMNGATMSRSENSCCKAMHGHCGEMAKTGCCRTEVPDTAPQLAAASPQIHIHWLVSLCIAPVIAAPQGFLGIQHDLPATHSPPNLLTAQTTVLRI